MIYDSEAIILSLELTRGQITHAREFGNLIIHLSRAGKPILVEILDASSLTGDFAKLDKKNWAKFLSAEPIV
jgi:uncharacterized protein YuzE